MSLQDYRQAKELIQQNGGDFAGAKQEALIVIAEKALGVAFPPSYRLFLLELGCGDINGFEVYGLLNDIFGASSVPNGIWLTLHERKNLGLPSAFVLIGDSGDGNYIAIDTSTKTTSEENPIVRLSVDGGQSIPVATSFGTYLLDGVRSVV